MITVKVGTYENPPKIFIDNTGKIGGFWPDLTAYIASKEHWRITYVPGTWQEGLENLQTSRIDVMPDVAYTEDRAKRFIFSKAPVLVSWTRLYVRENNTHIQSIKDWKNKKITALSGSVNIEGSGGLRELVHQFGLNCTIIGLHSYQQVFRAVETGTVDAGITNRNFGNQYGKEYRVKATAIIFQPVTMRFAFPRQGRLAPYLLAKVNHPTARLKQDGNSLYYSLLTRYFETEIAEKPVPRLPSWFMPVILSVLGAMFFGFGVFIISRFQVRRKTRELKASHERLRESEERFRLTFYTSPDAITLSRLADGVYVDVNQGFTEITGFRREDVVGKTSLQVDIWANPEDRERLSQGLKRDGRVTNLVAPFRTKDGRIITGMISANVIQINGVSHIISITRNIEDMIQTQCALEESLRELEQLYQLSLRIRKAQDSNTIANEALRLVRQAVEPSIALLYLRDGDHLQLLATETDHLEFSFNDVRRHRVGECLCGLASQGARPIFSKNIFEDHRCTLKECKKAGVRSFAALPLVVGNRIIGVIGLGSRTQRDFSSRRAFLETLANEVAVGFHNALLVEQLRRHEAELEKQVATRTAELMAANRELEAFSYSVSHDLRAPLRAIDGFSRILAEDYIEKLDDEARRLIGIVRNNAQRMAELIDDLLTFSRISRQSITLSSIDMAGLAGSLFFELTNEQQREKIHFMVQDLPPLQADASLIRQVFHNLISNAIKFSGRREQPRIEVGSVVEDAWLTYYIKDNGVGFDMKYADKLFRIFQRLHSADEFEGTGIGLSIVHRIVTRHGGRVWAEAEVNKGATFYVALPVGGENV